FAEVQHGIALNFFTKLKNDFNFAAVLEL
ncbi:hypothetical protein CFC21_032578, partial [Triticum aestivum]